MMRWMIGFAMALGSGPAALAVDEEIPEFGEFEIVVSRNVFDSTRRPRREEAEPPAEPRDPPPPQREARSLVLAGVFLPDDRGLALFVANGGICRNVEVGGEVEGMAVVAVDSGGARLRVGEKEFAVAVGERLSDGGSDEWTVVGRAPQAPSVQQVADERKTADRAELLRQMMERRKRELEP